MTPGEPASTTRLVLVPLLVECSTVAPAASTAARRRSGEGPDTPSRQRRVTEPDSSASTRVPSKASCPAAMTMIRSHSTRASGSTWVENSTRCSRPYSHSTSRMSHTFRGSSPAIGSSRMRTGGEPITAWAIPTRCR